MDDASYIEGDSFACMPFTGIRKTRNTSILQIVLLLPGRSASPLGPADGGVVRRNDSTNVVPLL